MKSRRSTVAFQGYETDAPAPFYGNLEKARPVLNCKNGTERPTAHSDFNSSEEIFQLFHLIL